MTKKETRNDAAFWSKKSVFELCFVSICVLILVKTGLWQLERREEKLELIRQVSERYENVASELPDAARWSTLKQEDYDYRPVRISGVFDHGAERHVFTTLSKAKGTYSGLGYWVMTPFALETGGTVFVNRGFVPETFRQPKTRLKGQVEGHVGLEGFMRKPERGSFFTPGYDKKRQIFFLRNPKHLLSAALNNQDKTRTYAPFYIEAKANQNGVTLPQGGETYLAFTNRHLEYAFTWFGMAVALLAIYALVKRRSRRCCSERL